MENKNTKVFNNKYLRCAKCKRELHFAKINSYTVPIYLLGTIDGETSKLVCEKCFILNSNKATVEKTYIRKIYFFLRCAFNTKLDKLGNLIYDERYYWNKHNLRDLLTNMVFDWMQKAHLTKEKLKDIFDDIYNEKHKEFLYDELKELFLLLNSKLENNLSIRYK